VAKTATSAAAARQGDAATQQAIIDQLAQTCGLEGRGPTEDERTAFRLAETAMARLTAEARRLRAVADAHESEHTHPAFACDKHEGSLTASS
jgi:hypothetical protein